jgi:hypothetical protein
MIILGVDPSATQTGLAVVPVPGRDSEVVCASFTAEGDSPEAKADDWGRQFADALTVWKPDYVVHEIAMRYIAGYAKKGRPDLAGGTAGFWTPNSDQLRKINEAWHRDPTPTDGQDQVMFPGFAPWCYGRGLFADRRQRGAFG